MENENLLSVREFCIYVHAKHEQGFVFKGHSHKTWEVTFVLDGELEIYYEERLIRLKKNSIILFEPNVFHGLKVISNHGSEHLAFQFFSNSIPIMKEPSIYEADEYLLNLAGLIKAECEQSKYYFAYFNRNLNTIATQLLGIFLIKLMNNSTNDFKQISDSDAIIFETAVKYMKDNLSRSLNVKEIADACFVSVSKIKRVFYKYSQIGIIHFFNNLKLKKAYQYLEKGESIINISNYLGFSSQSYFSSWFKNLTGQPPIKYKNGK